MKKEKRARIINNGTLQLFAGNLCNGLFIYYAVSGFDEIFMRTREKKFY